jgi:SSS family solute:Na+ symporter
MDSGALTLIDWLIILIYLVCIVWLGTRFGKRQKNADRYFLGIRNLPFWAVGISMFATIISSWSFIALPGKAFKSDLQYLMAIATLPVSTLITVKYIIPLFRNKIKLSAYEYLERRFGLPARIYGNITFIIVHFGKMGAILYLLSLAVSGMTGWNIFLLIAIIGFATVIYTFFGGIEGVVWSDVTQGILLLFGGIISFFYLLFTVPGGPENLLTYAYTSNKIKLITLELDWDTISVTVLLLFGFNYFLQKYISDQTVVQRYLLSSTEKQASRALWMSTGLIMFVWLLFMSIGALLWAYYRLQPGILPVEMWTQPDRVFPYFIGHQLPAGITGLILAGLLAATMSTLSSDLNSLGAVLFDDYYKKLSKRATDHKRLSFSRMSVLISGLLAMVLAMSMTQIKSMADAAFNFVSLVAGGVLGMYVLGMFTRRTSHKGLYFGIFIGIVFILWGYFSNPDQAFIVNWLPRFPLHTLWIGLSGNMVVFVTGFTASLLLTPNYRCPSEITAYKNNSAHE